MRGNRIKNGSQHLARLNIILNSLIRDDADGPTLLDRLPSAVGKILDQEDEEAFFEFLFLIVNRFPDEVPLNKLTITMDGGDRLNPTIDDDGLTDIFRFRDEFIVVRGYCERITTRRKGLWISCVPSLWDPIGEFDNALLEAGWRQPEDHSIFFPPDDLIDSLLSIGWEGDYIERS